VCAPNPFPHLPCASVLTPSLALTTPYLTRGLSVACPAAGFVTNGFTPLQLKYLRDQIFAFKSLKKMDYTLDLFTVAYGASPLLSPVVQRRRSFQNLLR